MPALRRLRPVSDPLAGYIRVGSADHSFLTSMIVANRPVGAGLVVEATRSVAQSDLIQAATSRGIEVVLDPLALELSTPAGFARSGVANLDWAGSRPHTPKLFNNGYNAAFTEKIVRHVVEHGFTSVIAPTHIVDDDPGWLSTDLELTAALRESLDSAGLSKVPIYYRWDSHFKSFAFCEARDRIVRAITNSPIDSIWLRLHPFGTSSSGPLSLSRYIVGCRELHEFKIPLVAEHTGTVGVALMAFGAVGGIESGVLRLERTDHSGLKVSRVGTRFNNEAKIYLHRLGASLGRHKAKVLFERPGMKSAQGCMSPDCCPRGARDTLHAYREHFVHARAREITTISAVPEPLRPGWYMENFLRPATDRAVRASELEPALKPVRKRLDQWRGALGAELEKNSEFSVSNVPTGRRLRRTA